MRLRPFFAAGAAVLLCAFLASCASTEAEEAPQEAAAEPPSPAEASPTTEEADDSGAPSDGPEKAPLGEPVGWAAVPLATDGGEELPELSGGAEGETVTADSAEELAEYLTAEEPLVVEVSGRIDLDGDVEVGSHKTLTGVGEEDGDWAELTGGGLVIDGSRNVVVHNVLVEAEKTALSVRGDSSYVWIHGSTFEGGEGPLVSITGGADLVTLSWNHFREAESALVIGGEDEEPGRLRVTVQQNYFDGTARNNPRVRNAAQVDVFSNYFRANGEYGVQSEYGSEVAVTGNYFDGAKRSVTVDENNPGDAEANGNLLVDTAQPDNQGTVEDPPYTVYMSPARDIPDIITAGAGVGGVRWG
ncbi:pectate lyase family protein [Nocardiopsis algeriensis]|uniref:Pectate lyase n=1 Tax=Nocardiopsis algeriensis TaxID=1478215 RepID=A0A841IWS4_9ACTN|nr:right-handed parallel beta-helix repeat-containing protein [Nocardiopsis algeriensis]MBB6120658.1 pectate lyase [Nocardiopsis algeriensis]